MAFWNKQPSELDLLHRELAKWLRHEQYCQIKLIEAEHKIAGLRACINHLQNGEDDDSPEHSS